MTIKFYRPVDGFKEGDVKSLSAEYENLYVERNYAEVVEAPVKKTKKKAVKSLNASVEGSDD